MSLFHRCSAAFLVFFAAVSHAQTPVALPQPETLRIDSIMNGLMKKYKITGASMGIVDQHQLVYAQGYGFADKKNKVAAGANTIYGIGSITKTFTALAIMKLHAEGKIDLNKPAKYYLPELTITSLVESGDILKIKDLLNHTSGLPSDIMNGDFCDSMTDFHTVITELNKQVLTEPGGWKMNYSNLGFDLLGCIIEKVSGEKYEDYIRQYILQPVNMLESTFNLKENDPAFSKGYMKDSIETPEPNLREVPAGALCSNIPDMSKFMMMLMDEGQVQGSRVIPASAIQSMETDHLKDLRVNGDKEFGYGLFIERMYNEEDSITGMGVGHAGDTYVHHSTMFIFPKMHLGFVVLSNSEEGHNFCNTALLKLFAEYITRVKNIPLHQAASLRWSAKALNNNITDYREVEGAYGTGSDSYVYIKYKNPKKLAFKQDRNTLILKLDSAGLFRVVYHLMGFFPIRVKGVHFAFETIDGRIYLKQLSDRLKVCSYLSAKEKTVTLSQPWKNAVGPYQAINACAGNMQGTPYELKIVNNRLILMVSFPGESEHEGYSFDQLSDTLAAIDGIDRGCGEIMKILPNGNLYFSGYELQPVSRP